MDEDKLFEEEEFDSKEEINKLNDKYLRLYSEFDNYRKRVEKEKTDLIRYASSNIIIDVLPILDDLNRSLSTDYDEGIELIYNKFLNILNNKGIEKIKSLNESFNTDFHEAVNNKIVFDSELDGKIIEEVEEGYTLNGKVIRYSKVIVGKKN